MALGRTPHNASNTRMGVLVKHAYRGTEAHLHVSQEVVPRVVDGFHVQEGKLKAAGGERLCNRLGLAVGREQETADWQAWSADGTPMLRV